jgi:exosortase/archaeosortase family protein
MRMSLKSLNIAWAADVFARGISQRVLLSGWVLVVNWEVVRWYIARLGDGGDEPWGLMALVAALLLTPRSIWRSRISDTACGAVAMLAIGGIFGTGYLPMLVRAGLVAGALGVAIGAGEKRSASAGAAGRLGLLLLSLPVMVTAQFYAGYPLRVMTAELGRPLLALLGVATERVGVVLNWSGGAVIVDAPCSGVRMLWAGAAFACGLAAWRRMTWGKTMVFVAAVVGGVIVANALRAAFLFLVESGVWPAAAWVHEAVGTLAFGAVAIGAMAWASRVQGEGVGREPERPQRTDEAEVAGWKLRVRRGVLIGLGVFGLAWPLLGAAFARETRERDDAGEFPGWPDVFEGRPLMPVVNTEEGRAFTSGFPGKTQVFRQEERLVVLRWITAASRAVHPAADCFRARGYRVESKGLVKDAGGALWSEFTAARGEEGWRVRERWRDPSCGDEWTDVSAWWWAAQKRETRGPWYAETVAWRE